MRKFTLTLKMENGDQDIETQYIKNIRNGIATTITGRQYPIVCDCLEAKDYETVDADEESNIPESYIVCNCCNRVHYLSDLKDQQEQTDD